MESMNSCLKMKRKAKEETPFMRNGRMLLEGLIAFGNGKSNPIHIFSAKELRRATSNYDQCQHLLLASDFDFYKGSLEDYLISVKKYRHEISGLNDIIKDIVLGSQMRVHQNVLKLLGCCLETKNPIIVYEFVGARNLYNCICIPPTKRVHSEPLPWKCRLKIAMGIDNAIAYLHTSFSRPTIHRNVRLHTIILDNNYVAKPNDFSLSICIFEGQLHVETDICGTTGYVAPEYFFKVNEKTDLYSFGMPLLTHLTGWFIFKW